MEIVPAFKPFRFQILGNKFQSGTKIHCKRPFAIRSSDENHGTAGRVFAFQEDGLYAILLLVTLEERSKVIVTNLTDKSRLHAENGCAGDSISCRSSCDKLYSERLQCLPDLISRFHIHMLHAAFRQFQLLQQRIIRKHCKDVSQCVSYS